MDAQRPLACDIQLNAEERAIDVGGRGQLPERAARQYFASLTRAAVTTL